MLPQFDTSLARFTRIPVEWVDEEQGEPDGGERELLAPNEYEGDVLGPESDEEGRTKLSKLSTCVLNLLEYDSVQCQKRTARSL